MKSSVGRGSSMILFLFFKAPLVVLSRMDCGGAKGKAGTPVYFLSNGA